MNEIIFTDNSSENTIILNRGTKISLQRIQLFTKTKEWAYRFATANISVTKTILNSNGIEEVGVMEKETIHFAQFFSPHHRHPILDLAHEIAWNKNQHNSTNLLLRYKITFSLNNFNFLEEESLVCYADTLECL